MGRDPDVSRRDTARRQAGKLERHAQHQPNQQESF
jgi:hypothetical protein